MAKIQHSLRGTEPLAASVSSARLPRLIESYLLGGDISRHSERTLDARRDLLGKLVWFLKDRDISDCDEHALKLFLHHVTHGHKESGGRWGNPRCTRPTKPRTAKNYHGILRAFFNALVVDGDIGASPMERIATPIDRPDQVQPFTDDQMKKILAAARRTLHPRRDEAILLLLLDTGMRASELCALTCGDVDIQTASVTVEGKGGKKRTLYFSRDVRRALFGYLNEREYAADATTTSPIPTRARCCTRRSGSSGAGARTSYGRCRRWSTTTSARRTWRATSTRTTRRTRCAT